MPTSRVPGFARVALAAIRFVNGSAALAAPALLARNLGVRREDNEAVQYVFRMFGITRQIPARPALTLTSISALNTALAVAASAGELRTGAAA